MLIMAAICPPAAVVDELRAAITEADASSSPPPAVEAPRRRWFGSAAPPTLEAGTGPTRSHLTAWLEPIIPIVRFGNLTRADGVRVAKALEGAAVAWEPATVHLAAVTLGDADLPPCLRVSLDGDLAGLTNIARAVGVAAESLDFYLDRRLFRPELDVATLSPAATAEDLTALTQHLVSFSGRPWTVDHVSVLRQTFGDGTSEFVEAHRIPIGQP